MTITDSYGKRRSDSELGEVADAESYTLYVPDSSVRVTLTLADVERIHCEIVAARWNKRNGDDLPATVAVPVRDVRRELVDIILTDLD